MASNLNTPIDALNELADDYSSDVQQAAASPARPYFNYFKKGAYYV